MNEEGIVKQLIKAWVREKDVNTCAAMVII